MMKRTIGLFLLVATLGVAARDTFAGGSPHPHFNDQGTLTWFRTLGEAMTAARAEGKVIFVECGRLRCKQCRVLCCNVLPHPDVRARLSKIAVGLASDCDDPEPAVDGILRRHIPDATVLPFVGFLRADGRWITGFAGARTVDQLRGDLDVAERVLAEERCSRPTAKAAPTTPQVSRTAVAASATAPRPPPSAREGSARTQAEDAARRGAWGEVVRHCRAAGRADPALVALENQARTWAQTRLTAAVSAIQARRYDEAFATVGSVRETMRGEPEADDASRGLVAIRYAKELASLEAEEEARAKVRKDAHEELRGTRWERLFG